MKLTLDEVRTIGWLREHLDWILYQVLRHGRYFMVAGIVVQNHNLRCARNRAAVLHFIIHSREHNLSVIFPGHCCFL